MTNVKFPPRVRRLKNVAIIVFSIFIMAVGYVYFLHVENREIAVAEAERRQNDPVGYLSEIRLSQGFYHYLAAFRRVYGYDRFQQAVPPFLLGRWSLYAAPQRVTDEYVPPTCADSIAIEDGRIKTYGKHARNWSVTYRIVKSTVEARTAGGTMLPIRLVSYDVNLHHIEVTLPGDHKPLYGYLCR